MISIYLKMGQRKSKRWFYKGVQNISVLAVGIHIYKKFLIIMQE